MFLIPNLLVIKTAKNVFRARSRPSETQRQEERSEKRGDLINVRVFSGR